MMSKSERTSSSLLETSQFSRDFYSLHFGIKLPHSCQRLVKFLLEQSRSREGSVWLLELVKFCGLPAEQGGFI